MIPPRNTVRQVAEAPIIQYSSGHTKGRRGAAGAFAPFVGFTSEQGKDDAFDAACGAARIDTIDIRHQRPGGSEIKRHWYFGETLGLYPLTSGPVAASVSASLANGNAAKTRAAGIGARWGSGGERSKLAVRGLLPILVPAGYAGIVQLGVRSRMTDRLLAALVAHTQVAELADALVNREHHPDPVGPWELVLPLGPGEEEIWGKGDTASVVPLQATHPEPARIDRDYIRAIFLAMRHNPARDALIEAWAETVVWAEEYAAGHTADPMEDDDEPVR